MFIILTRMKLSLIKVLVVMVLTAITFTEKGDGHIQLSSLDMIYASLTDTVELDTPVMFVKLTYDVNGDLASFLDKMAFRESQGDHLVVNRYGCMGKYQFKRSTLDYVGFSDVSDSIFLNNPEIQDDAMIALLKNNERILGKYLDSFDGVVRDSVLITKSGMLAGAHLVGAGGVLSYLRQDSIYRTYDGNDVHVSEYIDEFKGYDLNL